MVKFMACISEFFSDMKTDISTVLEDKTWDTEARNALICSIALRVLGTIVGTLSVVTLLTGVSLIAGSALSALGYLVTTAVGIVLAHEFIQMGANERAKALVFATPTADADLLEYAADAVGSIGNTLKGKAREASTGTPTLLQDTWVFEPIYKFIQKSK
jgi:hypothetical protein